MKEKIRVIGSFKDVLFRVMKLISKNPKRHWDKPGNALYVFDGLIHFSTGEEPFTLIITGEKLKEEWRKTKWKQK